MPELPDILLYMACLGPRIVGQPIERAAILNPFVLRSVDPPVTDIEGRVVRGLRRIGKRIVLCLDDELFVVIHLMIAGRLRWQERVDGRPMPAPGRIALALLDFPSGRLLLTEAGSKKRASLHVVRHESALAAHDRGGLEVLEADASAFRAALRRENHTLKRALTDPRLFSGIGNAWSDEILHRARLSPLALTQRLCDEEVEGLRQAAQETLRHWTEELQRRIATGFPGPGEVTAFRPGMAVHGRYGLPCPVCGTKVERITYADNETNYCPRCQTGGRRLADRSLSRLLGRDWPRAVEDA